MSKKKPHAQAPSRIERRPIFGERSTLISILIIVAIGCAFFNRIVFAGDILTGGDVLAGAAIFEQYADQQIAGGHFPFWNPYIFGGMPFFESMTWSAFVYPSFWIKRALETIPGVELPRLFFLFLHYLLAGVGMFFYLRSRRVGHGGAVLGGAAFMLTPHLVGLATIGHGGKVLAATYIPLVLMASQRLLETGKARWIAILGLIGGLQFLARHAQVSYYTWLGVLVLLIYYVVTRRRDGERVGLLAGRSGKLVVGIVLAGCLAAMLLVPLVQYSAYSTRAGEAGGMGFEQATMWSMHPKELMTLLVPSFLGLAGQTYWGPMPFEQVSHYFGYVVLCLAVIAAFRGRRRETGFLVALLAFGIFLSLGKYISPIYRVLYVALPGFSRFRVPALFLLLSQFAAAALAGHGASVVLGEGGEKPRDWLKWAVGLAAVGAIVGLVVMGARSAIAGAAARVLTAKYSTAEPALLRQAAAAAARMAFRDGGILLVFAAATGIAVFVVTTRRLAAWIGAALLVGLVVWDVTVVDMRFMHPEKMLPLSAYYPTTPAVAFLERQPKPFRIAAVSGREGPNSWMYHRIESIGGYHPAKLRVIDDLLTKVGIGNLKLLALLNVRYVVGPETLDHPAFRNVAPGVHEFLGTLPRVWLAGESREVRPEAALAEYGAATFDPTAYVDIEGTLPGPVESTDGSEARLVSDEPERIEVHATIARPCLLVCSEVYYPPGWRAFVDGVETRIYRTDYAFRSVYLTPGEHTVVMKYIPSSFRRGLLVSLLAAVAIVLLWVLPARARSGEATP